MKLKTLLLALLMLMALPLAAQEDAAGLTGTPAEICEAATPASEPETRDYSAAEEVLEAGVDYRAIICTSAGAIYLDLFEDFAPLTVNNFVFLAEQNYYNNTIFHRVMEDFMAQGGDPTGTGTGGPGYTFGDEFVGFITFDRPGLLAMANSGPATNGSQFFITTAETPWLNGAHTIFGDVLEGQADAVENILLRDPAAGGDSTSLDTVVIIRDADAVETTFEETVEVATVDTFVEALDGLGAEGVLPPDLTFNGAESLETADVVALAPEELQEDYAALLEANGHAYRASALVENSQCNAEYFFAVMSYSVDAFESADAASAVLADDFLAEYSAAVGYTAIDTGDAPYNAYRNDAAICGDGETVITLDMQRGRYIATVNIVYSAGTVAQVGGDAALAEITSSNIAQLFEGNLGAAYRSELR